MPEVIHKINQSKSRFVDELDLAELHGVVNIDDDNEPLPENIPVEGESDDVMGEWGHNGVCERRKMDQQLEDIPSAFANVEQRKSGPTASVVQASIDALSVMLGMLQRGIGSRKVAAELIL